MPAERNAALSPRARPGGRRGHQGWDKPQLGAGGTGCKRRLKRHIPLQPSTPPPPSQNGFWQNSNYSAPGFSNEVEKKKKILLPG